MSDTSQAITPGSAESSNYCQVLEREAENFNTNKLTIDTNVVANNAVHRNLVAENLFLSSINNIFGFLNIVSVAPPIHTRPTLRQNSFGLIMDISESVNVDRSDVKVIPQRFNISHAYYQALRRTGCSTTAFCDCLRTIFPNGPGFRDVDSLTQPNAVRQTSLDYAKEGDISVTATAIGEARSTLLKTLIAASLGLDKSTGDVIQTILEDIRCGTNSEQNKLPKSSKAESIELSTSFSHFKSVGQQDLVLVAMVTEQSGKNNELSPEEKKCKESRTSTVSKQDQIVNKRGVLENEEIQENTI